ncbi:glutamate--tRNA ligase [Clostridium baratii]|uniref:glutamate--tRNA ligase n=1 Tax=Clostridium baratii TaxID=1561 RepID=UPI00097FB895|nr:glutamate--tRNA ligase [Clostridium baratii]AQM59275.1 glutamate--tRNA ligase [Clostridium baratii]
MSREALANLIFKKDLKTREDYLKEYGDRKVEEGARVLRYAPSPTGFQHIGGVYTSIINERLAHQSGGVFYLRIEDTDQKREVEGAIEDTIATMHNFGMDFDEGQTGENTDKGAYGPYKQSERRDIYQAFAKDLLLKGLAYPCFCTTEELNEIREKQMAEKITTGYYGKYAIYRDLPVEEAIKKIENGEEYIIRLKSPGKEDARIEFHDLIKGDVSFPENLQDVVIIKSDGLPTYHFAHVIDDALMHTTDVIRGEEWLSSLPTHLQLFDVLGFKRPNYAHVPTIMKTENGSKRKLSKRKDPESAVSYYREEGYPSVSVIEYLLNIINSSFEDWRAENPDADYHEFPVLLEKMSKSGALFDIVKLHDVSKNVICKMKPEVVYDYYVAWAKDFDKEMYDLVTKNEAMMKEVFNIDKEGPKPRKDFGKWNEVREKIFYFFDKLFDKETAEDVELPKTLNLEDAKNIIENYAKVYNFNTDQETWFEELKALAVELGYATNRKEYKSNPENFKGMVSDVAGAVRAALTHRTNTPDLYTIMQIMGEDKVRDRFKKFINL